MQIRLTRLWSTAGSCPMRVEQLNQIELIEEVMLVPEHELVVGRMVVNCLTPAPQLGDRFREGDARSVVSCQVTGANVQQLFIRQPRRHRSFVQRISPD